MFKMGNNKILKKKLETSFTMRLTIAGQQLVIFFELENNSEKLFCFFSSRKVKAYKEIIFRK